MYNFKTGMEVTEAQVFLTRQCNSRCGGCNLPASGQNLYEIDLEEWKIVFLNLHNLKIKTVKIMGGEPTEVGMQKLIDLIRFIKKNTNIRVGLLSNSKWDKSIWIKQLCTSGLFAYFASVDTVNTDGAICQDSLVKSQQGYQTLLALKEDGRIPLLATNVVLSKRNMHQICNLAQTLSSDGFFINICPFQCYKIIPKYGRKKIEYQYRKGNQKFMFAEDNIFALQQIVIELVDLQSMGVKISVPASYLLNIPKYGLYGGTWQCKNFYQLRVDADGTVMMCNEFRWPKKSLPNLGTLINDVVSWERKLIDNWYQERLKFQCQCYWSCFLQAEENIRIRSVEFGFFDNPKLHGIGIDK